MGKATPFLIFGAVAVGSVAVLKDFRGIVTKYAQQYPLDSLAYKRAVRSSLAVAWFGLIISVTGLISAVAWL
jgi:hypothetical protein